MCEYTPSFCTICESFLTSKNVMLVYNLTTISNPAISNPSLVPVQKSGGGGGEPGIFVSHVSMM